MNGEFQGTPPDERRALDYWALLVAVMAVSCAAPLVRLAASGPEVVAFWRVAFAATGAWVLLAARGRLRSETAGLGWAALAGVFLALHFWAWITSLYHTSVANSVLLVCTQPVWAALMGRLFLRERVPRIGWLGILLALTGAGLTAGYDSLQLGGDLLALLGAVLAALYMVVGRRQRQTWDTLPYVARVHGTAAIVLGVIMVAKGASFIPPASLDWWIFLALAAVPTGIGHTLYNVLLKHLPAYAVSTGITGEPIGASLLALWWLGEAPPERTLWAAPLVLVGILLVGWSRRAKARATGP
jgi:drug/metabolite transporter (DMT)-like permease